MSCRPRRLEEVRVFSEGWSDAAKRWPVGSPFLLDDLLDLSLPHRGVILDEATSPAPLALHPP